MPWERPCPPAPPRPGPSSPFHGRVPRPVPAPDHRRPADAGLPLSATEAGSIGSALLLSSATAGFLLASRVDRSAPAGSPAAACSWPPPATAPPPSPTTIPLVVLGAIVGGLGSGTITSVAATGIAGQRDPTHHHPGPAGCLRPRGHAVSDDPPPGSGPRPPPRRDRRHRAARAARDPPPAPQPAPPRPPTPPPPAPLAPPPLPLPHRRAGLVLGRLDALLVPRQNSLWGVSGRIGLRQAGLTEVTVGAVFAVALGAGLLGVIGAGTLGRRLGRALIGAGTALIAGCIALSAAATDLTSFATGEIAWNTVYPVVLSYVIGLAASLDRRGRSGGPRRLRLLARHGVRPARGQSALSARVGYPGMGVILALGLLLIARPDDGRGPAHPARRAAPAGAPPSWIYQVVEIPVVETRSWKSRWTPSRHPERRTTRQGPGRRPRVRRPGRGPEAGSPSRSIRTRTPRPRRGSAPAAPRRARGRTPRTSCAPVPASAPGPAPAPRHGVEGVADVPAEVRGVVELTVHSSPASSIAGSGWSSRTSTARSRTFDSGQSVSGTRTVRAARPARGPPCSAARGRCARRRARPAPR